MPWGRRGCSGEDVNPLQPCAGGFPYAMEDGVAIFVADEKLMLAEIGSAVGITQLPQAEEIMGEARHNVSRTCILCWDGWDAELGCCR